MHSSIRNVATTLGVLLCHAALAQAPSEHQFAYGLGLAGLSTPHYIGSDQRRDYVVPFPYIDYRGPFLEVDRQDGVRARLFDGARNAIKLSIDLRLPVDSDDNDARQGMPDLDLSVGIGPQLDTTIGWYKDCRFSFRLPLRARFEFDGLAVPEYIGLVSNPALDMYCTPLIAGIKVGVRAGPVFVDDKMASYFYGVPPEFATPERPAYTAEGGFAGYQGRLTASRSFGSWWIGAFMRYDQIGDAVFADSPLVIQDDGVTVGLAAAWIFKSNIDY